MFKSIRHAILALALGLSALPVSVAQPPRAAQAASGSWTQTQWNGNRGFTGVQSSGTTNFAEAY
ncbi:MAG: hypothetical protein ACUVR3_04510, partial [Candidatus Roseilinea sp.]|uniref:hypothetical protein n=1 Tax=Candidatus Roseilinea sp. TaxID=2838777 RepID=UPI00404B6C11